MPDLERVHRFREHPIAGVNWRPTRFVAEVPSSRVCGLCRMIPKRTVLLPCEHTLCQSCYAASWQGCSGLCPLDQEPFEEAECSEYDLPTRKWNALKAHCWNEDKGCQFVGPVETLLRHYERDCGFRSIQCSTSRERVLLKDLPVHCNGDECTATGEAAVAASASSNPTRDATPSVSSITDTVEEQKRQLREIHSHVAVMQSQVEKLHGASAMRVRKAQELQRQQADRERQPKGGSLLRKFNNSLRRSFGKARKARESESVQQLAETVDSVGESSQL